VGDLELITAGGYHFARKFDLSQNPGVLDALDERLEG
jgi:hypothetical protein